MKCVFLKLFIMRTALVVPILQECTRYNGLITLISQSLKDCLKALKGFVVMSPELEMVSSSIYDNQVRNETRDASEEEAVPNHADACV